MMSYLIYQCTFDEWKAHLEFQYDNRSAIGIRAGSHLNKSFDVKDVNFSGDVKVSGVNYYSRLVLVYSCKNPGTTAKQ